MTPEETRETIQQWFGKLIVFRNSGAVLVRPRDLQILLDKFPEDKKEGKDGPSN